MVNLLNKVTAVFMMMMLGSLLAMILARDVFNQGYPWLDDIARFLLLWTVFIAAIVLTIRGDHIRMDAAYEHMPQSYKTVVQTSASLALFICAVVVAYLGLNECIEMWRLGEVSASGVFPAVLGYAAIPTCFVLIAFASLYSLLVTRK